jgi:predicted peptidase
VQRSIVHLFASALAFLAAGCGGLDMTGANAAAPAGTGFMVKEVVVDGQAHKYGLFIPHRYDKATPTPTIVFLHGLLQAGSDGATAMKQGLGPCIAKRPTTFPAIAAFPQSDGDWTGDARDKLAMAVLTDVEAHYNVDRDRVTLTGLSNGGYGTWRIGGNHPERFSALVPIAGQGDPDSVPRLIGIPVWCFHNSGDVFVNVGAARSMVAKLRAAGATLVQYTEFQAFGHGGWDQVYDDPKILDWMLAQRISTRGRVAGRGN